MSWETEAVWVAHAPAPYRELMHAAYDAIGLQVDQINFLCIIVIAFVMGFVYRFVPGRLLRHLFGSSVGMALLYLLYGPENCLFIAGYVLLCYLLIRTKSARLTFVGSMGVLFTLCGYLMMDRYWSGSISDYRIDVSTIIMGLCVRINMLIYDILDGEDLKAGKQLHKKPHIQQRRANFALTEPLSLLEYISYMTFFPTVIAGSNPQIKHYLKLVDGSLFTDAGLKSAPYPWGRMISSFVQGIIAAGIFLVLGNQYFPFSAIGGAAWLQHNLFMRVFLVSWTTYLGKAKYHFSWHWVDLSRFSSGLGFSGVEKKEDKVVAYNWDACANINFICEFAQHTGEVVNNWNMTVNTWLKFYVFERFSGLSKGSALLATRVTSAVFHGTYPSYYIFFMLSGVWSNWHEMWRQRFPQYKDCKDTWYGSLVWFFWYIFTISWLHSLGYLFVQWDVYASWEVYKNIYFLPVLLIVVTWPILLLIPKRKREPRKGQKPKSS